MIDIFSWWKPESTPPTASELSAPRNWDDELELKAKTVANDFPIGRELFYMGRTLKVVMNHFGYAIVCDYLDAQGVFHQYQFSTPTAYLLFEPDKTFP